MKEGDLIRYKNNHWSESAKVWEWKKGLLVEFDKVQRMCIILDNKSGNIIKKHCSDVQLVSVGHRSR